MLITRFLYAVYQVHASYEDARCDLVLLGKELNLPGALRARLTYELPGLGRDQQVGRKLVTSSSRLSTVSFSSDEDVLLGVQQN